MSDPGEQGFSVDLARRLYRALTAEATELFSLLQDPTDEVLRTLLKNPRLSEGHLLALLKRRNLSEDLLKEISRLDAVASSHRLKVGLSRNPGTPGMVLQGLLNQLYLFELLEICYLPGVTPDQKVAAERVILQRLPTVPLGNKLTLARRGTATLVDALLKEGDLRLMDACLQNQRLREVSLLQFLNGPAAAPETISCIAGHPRWQQRPNVRLALLKNPRTPAVWFTVHLPRLTSADLRGLLAAKRLLPSQKRLVEEEFGRRSQGKRS